MIATHILLVDDFSTTRKMVRTYLKELGFSNIWEAEDVSAALERLNEGEFQLIVSKWKMPKMMGHELIEAVRENPKYAEVPVLFVAPEAVKEAIPHIWKSEVITKPFTAQELEAKLTELGSSY